jgi:multidrug efflux system membrane fusion protein
MNPFSLRRGAFSRETGALGGSLTGIVFLLGSLFSQGCSGGGGDASAVKTGPVPVRVETVSMKDVPVQLRAVGSVEASSTVTVKPQAAGILERVHFEEGQEVRRGDLLFTIDPRPYQALVAQAEANLARDEAQARNAEALVKRYADLVERDFVTQEQFEQIQTNADAMRAAHQADRAALEKARLDLLYCSIHSPIEGRTGSLKVHVGNVVKAEEAELVTIHRIRPVHVRFSVPEAELAAIRRHADAGGLKVEAIVMSSEGDARIDGALTFIDNTVDRGTGTIQLKASFDNEEGILWPGQFVDVVLTLATRKDAIVVSSQTVQTGQVGDYVFVVTPDSTVELRRVNVEEVGERETVIREGLSRGEIVVTDGQLNLVPGDRVVVAVGQEEEGKM